MISLRNKGNSFLIYILISTFVLSISFSPILARTKTSVKNSKHSKTKVIQKKNAKKSTQTKGKKKRRRRVRRPPFRETNLKMTTPINTVFDSVLSDGVVYKNILLGSGKFKHNIHLVEADISTGDARIAILKAKNHIDELEKLQIINHDYDSLSKNHVLASVNGNFWTAVTNYPIGPTVSNGEVIEMNTHKLWSSGLFDKNGSLFIGNFFINGQLISKNGRIYNVKTVNRRRDSTGIVVYNRFAGDSIPYIPLNNISKEIKRALIEVENDEEFTDSTDTEIDTAQIKNAIISEKRLAKVEYYLPKISLKYLKMPAVNASVPCKVIKFDTLAASVPENGCVVSFGRDIVSDYYPSVGDTVYLKFSTDIYDTVQFYNGVSGTPRLVRDNSAKPEAQYEGSHGSRFIKWQLPRTAIGTNEDKTKFYMVVVEPTGLHANCVGANLNQLSMIMKRLGCSDAMNLDGGGSSIMVINGKNIVLKTRPDASRRLSVGVAVVKKNQLNDAHK